MKLNLSLILLSEVNIVQMQGKITPSKQQDVNGLKIPIAKHSPNLQPIISVNTASSQLLNKLLSQPIPQLNLPMCSSLQQAAEVYYKEYIKLFWQNQDINNSLIEVITARNTLADRYNQLKRSKSPEQYVKRKRREAKDISRQFFCPIEKCNKGYGSEGSLTHHVRLKHKDYYESGNYQIFLQQFIETLTLRHKQHMAKHEEIVKLQQ